MKDYYAILEVPKTASSNSIRDAYRRLAKKYHPDVNSEPNAENFFKEVNEAYETLGDPEKRAHYDRPSYSFTEAPSSKPVHRDRAYQRRQPQPDHESDTQRLKRLSEEYKKYFVWLCRFGLAFSLLIGLDVILPATVSKEQILESNYIRSRRETTLHLRTNKGREIVLGQSAYQRLKDVNENGVIHLKISTIFSTVLCIQNQSGEQSIWIEWLYSTLSFFPIVLFMASLIGLVFKRRTEIVLNCGTISLLLSLISMGVLIY